MVNKLFAAVSQVTIPVNRLLAWIDFGIHYVSGYFLYYLMGGYKPQWHTRPGNRGAQDPYAPSVLVTGASEGIGLATSLLLANKGYTVFASVKDVSQLAHIKGEIKRRDVGTSATIHPLVMNVLDDSSITSAVEKVNSIIASNLNTPLVGVINNAGYCMISPMELTPDKAVRDLFELDFWAYISVIRAFLPIIKENQGRFINVGSYGGYVNPPMWAPYSAAKAGIEGLTRAWRFELRPFGVGMTTVRPGWTRTHGIGPKITSGWDAYFDNEGRDAGVDSLGDVVKSDKSAGLTEQHVYSGMMTKWYQLITAAADGAAQTAEAVAMSIYDVMIDPFLQPYYTVGYDALLGQMMRDLTPETIYEFQISRTFEGKALERDLASYKHPMDR